jgi:hypothetical protein
LEKHWKSPSGRRSNSTSEYTGITSDKIVAFIKQELIEAEAKRLHLTQGELTRLLEKARVEMGIDHAPRNDSDLPKGKGAAEEMSLEFLSKHPELAAEQLKITISKLQQIVSVSDLQQLRQYIDNPDNVTALQSSLLQILLQNNGEKLKNKS